METTDKKWALKTSGVSSDGRLLFAGLWPLVSVLIALHMDDISALFPARSLKYFFLGFPHKVVDTVPDVAYILQHSFASYTCPSVTWLALYQCSAMVEGFAVSPASSFFFFFFLGGGGGAFLLITS